MYEIHNSRDWWNLCKSEWPKLVNILEQLLPMGENTDPVRDTLFTDKPLRDIVRELFESEDRGLVDYFQEAWWRALDSSSIHNIPGWHVLCDLCSECCILCSDMCECRCTGMEADPSTVQISSKI